MMNPVRPLVRWYKLSHGVGKEMRDRGAELMACPHCGDDTPVYRSAYDSAGTPLSFTVCLWCEGLIEYSGPTDEAHEPYATIRDSQDRPVA